jgi:hypothetical protein
MFIAYLDADNWFHPNHLSSLLELHKQTQAAVCCSWRTFHRPDGTQLPIGVEPGERRFHHVDTSCFVLHRSTFPVLSVWHQMPRPLGPIGDRVLRIALERARFAFAFSKLRTVAFRSQYEAHYKMAGETPPPPFKPLMVFQPVREYLLSQHGVKETIDRIGFWPLSDKHIFK